jgi:hypothetical protein
MNYKVSIKAVAAGFVLDMGATFLFFLVMFFVYYVFLSIMGYDYEFIEDLFFNAKPMLVIFLMMGNFFTFLGGYLTGRIAKYSEVVHALVLGIIILTVTIILETAIDSDLEVPLWYTVIGYLIIVPSCFLGGYVSKRSNDKRRFDELS